MEPDARHDRKDSLAANSVCAPSIALELVREETCGGPPRVHDLDDLAVTPETFQAILATEGAELQWRSIRHSDRRIARALHETPAADEARRRLLARLAPASADRSPIKRARWSPSVGRRVWATAAVLLIGLGLGFGVWWSARPDDWSETAIAARAAVLLRDQPNQIVWESCGPNGDVAPRFAPFLHACARTPFLGGRTVVLHRLFVDAHEVLLITIPLEQMPVRAAHAFHRLDYARAPGVTVTMTIDGDRAVILAAFDARVLRRLVARQSLT